MIKSRNINEPLSRKLYLIIFEIGRSPGLRYKSYLPIITNSGLKTEIHTLLKLSIQLREQLQIFTGFPFNLYDQ